MNKCDKSFKNTSILQRHIKCVHDNNKLFKCNKCDKYFNRSDALDAHIKEVHDLIKSNNCDNCERCFSRNTYFQKYLKICTGELNISGGELAIIKALDILKLDYKMEYSVLLNPDTNCWLRFDFRIEIYNKVMIIEFNGEGHFKTGTFRLYDSNQSR